MATRKKLNVADKVAKVGSRVQDFENAISNMEKQGEFAYLALSQLIPNPENRDTYETFDVEQMKETIKLKGIVTPLVVMPHPQDPDRYQIISGETRFLAAKELDYEPLPCKIYYDVKTKADEHILSIYANVQREKTPTERARESEKLIAAYEEKLKEDPLMFGGMTAVEAAAKVLHLSVSVLNRDLRVLRLIPELQDLVDSGEINKNASENFADMPEDVQRQVLQLAEARRAEGEKISRVEAIQIKNEYKDELRRLQAEKRQAEQEIRSLEKEADRANAAVDTLQSRLEQERRKNQFHMNAAAAPKTNEKMEELQQKLAREQERAARLEAEARQKEARLSAIKDTPAITDSTKAQAGVLISTTLSQLALVEQNLRQLQALGGSASSADYQKLKEQARSILEQL